MDGLEYESKSYLKHDFMHFAFMKVIKSQEGFFGEKLNPMREETIVGVLQGAVGRLKEEGHVNYIEVIKGVNAMLEANNEQLSNLTEDEVRNIYTGYHLCTNHWEGMKTGEEYIIEI
jgi:hypothetical protein